MLKQTFAAQPHLNVLKPDVPHETGVIDTYHPYLTTPPRIYGEGMVPSPITGPTDLFLHEEQLLDGYEVIYLWVTNDMVWYPGYNYSLHRFNATTGEYLDRLITIADLFIFTVFAQARDGTIWRCYIDQKVYRCVVDPVTGVTSDNVVQYDFSTFEGVISTTCFNVDTERGIALIGANVEHLLRVHALATGSLLRTIALPASAKQIMQEDTDRCYVLCNNGVVCLVNYTLGVMLSSFRVQQAFDLSGGAVMAWDRKYRRLLFWSTPTFDTTGQNTSIITGYFPQPQAVGITAPIPLRPPRKYLTVPVLVRIYGDVGEPIGGTRVIFSSASGIAIFSGFPPLTDGDGECVAQMTGVDAGSATLTVTADVGATGALTPPVVITPIAGTPAFIPGTGTTFASTQSVSMGTTTLGAAIHYTTDGSTPTSGSTLYSAPITLSASTTLKAIAVLAGYLDSNVATAMYTLTSGSPVVPTAPTVGVLTAGDGEVSLAFTPNADGGAPVLHFTVLLSTGQTQTGSASPILVLCPNGVAVTATVTATNSAGTSIASAASNSATPVAAGGGGGGTVPQNIRIILQGQIVPNSPGASPPAPTNANYQKLSWDPVAGATLYKIYRSAVNGTTVALYDTSTVNNYADVVATGCVNGVVGPSGGGLANYTANRYLYRVTAVVGGVESAQSATQSYDHFKNGVLFGIGGNFNSGVSQNNSCTVAPMSGSSKFIRITQTGSFGFWLPFSGNNFTEWNLYLAGVTYLDFWCRGSAGVNLGMTCLRSGDVYIFNNSAGHKSVNLSAYATFVANTWIHYVIPIIDILGDYSSSGAGPEVIQRAFYKCLLQDHNNSYGTWDFDNGLWRP